MAGADATQGGARSELDEIRGEIARLRALNLDLLEEANRAKAAVAEAVILFEYIRDGDDFAAIVDGVDAFLAAHGTLAAEDS